MVMVGNSSILPCQSWLVTHQLSPVLVWLLDWQWNVTGRRDRTVGSGTSDWSTVWRRTDRIRAVMRAIWSWTSMMCLAEVTHVYYNQFLIRLSIGSDQREGHQLCINLGAIIDFLWFRIFILTFFRIKYNKSLWKTGRLFICCFLRTRDKMANFLWEKYAFVAWLEHFLTF